MRNIPVGLFKGEGDYGCVLSGRSGPAKLPIGEDSRTESRIEDWLYLWRNQRETFIRIRYHISSVEVRNLAFKGKLREPVGWRVERGQGANQAVMASGFATLALKPLTPFAHPWLVRRSIQLSRRPGS